MLAAHIGLRALDWHGTRRAFSLAPRREDNPLIRFVGTPLARVELVDRAFLPQETGGCTWSRRACGAWTARTCVI